MWKKSIVMILILCISLHCLSGCSIDEDVEIDGITYTKSQDLTDEKIELSYYSFEDEAVTRHMVERFMKLYPNIRVNYTCKNRGDYETDLERIVSNQELPDIIMYDNSPDFFLGRNLFMDISKYWEEDTETEELLSTINECGIGTFQSGVRYVVPFRYYPGAVFVDLNVLKKLNIEVPPKDWSWDQMLQIVEKARVKAEKSPDKMDFYGYYSSEYNLGDIYQTAVGGNVKGQSGFNGEKFDLTDWTTGIQAHIDLCKKDCISPGNLPNAFFESTASCDQSAHVAVLIHSFEHFQGTWNTAESKKHGFDIVPYVAPAVKGSGTSPDRHNLSKMEFAGISSSCKHPREAYELLKFMSYGKDGWKTRIQMYGDEKISTGFEPVKTAGMPAPVTKDEEIWQAYKDMFCEGMDKEHRDYWDYYFDRCKNPIPFGTAVIAGYSDYESNCLRREITGSQDRVYDRLLSGKYSLKKFIAEAEESLTWYHEQAMNDYFGK